MREQVFLPRTVSLGLSLGFCTVKEEKTMDLQVIAATWLLRNASRLPRRIALEECTQHLINAHGLGPIEASRIALQALAERESTNAQAWIDTDASTSHFIVLRRPGQKPVALTVSDLLRMTSTRLPHLTTH